ncbi:MULTISPECIES: AAA family ATPase [unclassified Salipiger]|uniref:AAA family ATPase n=1 Tax=unclassified Salipiger TaxID=2640570 RepID=UPI0013B836FF|nr:MULTISPECIES: AAA family ATPase [unclassified Salipiger]NDV49085.1 AAA family ATPase [Salipiger sp. PrR003]NDW31344.1 AAA family ATPase [Salipiger sp. PrR007]
MTTSPERQPAPAPILACTISRDVQAFDLLIEDMEALLGEAWGDLGFEDALTFLGQPDAASLEFIALAIDSEDEDNLPLLGQVIARATERGIKVVLIADDVTPASLHKLLRGGADEFAPYPLPEGELEAAVMRLRARAEAARAATMAPPAPETVTLKGGGDGVLIAAQGLCGGCGTTTFAVNLAWELATVRKGGAPRVCLIDLGLQFGTIATYLDLPRRDAVFELLSDIPAMDGDSFGQALVNYDDKLSVLTAPPDLLPLDILSPEDVKALLDTARDHFDFVVVDLPKTIAHWTETVLTESQVYFALIELDMRSAQNALRLKRALQSEDLPFEKLRFALNRAPKFTDLQGKTRAKRMAENLGIEIGLQLPDGGKQVQMAGDHGLPLAKQAAKNPLRKEIAKLAGELYAIGQSDAEAA